MAVPPQKKKLHFKLSRQFADPGLSSVTLCSRSGQSFLKDRLTNDDVSVFAQNVVWHLRHVCRLFPRLFKKTLTLKVVFVMSKC